VNTVYVEKGSDIDREFYLAVTLDRAVQKACVMASEINPLVVTGEIGDVIALDAKMNFDDNALFRHKTSSSCAT
jgi:succinyl-CoA synthetase beta subunit